MITVGVYFFAINPCSLVFLRPDSPRVISAEEHLLLSRAKEYSRRVNSYRAGFPYPTSAWPRLPKPTAATVSGEDAELAVSGPVFPGDLNFAAIWQHVFRQFHGCSPTVHMQISWRTGSLKQTFPVSEL
jgi:hypothetical protein